MGGRKNEKDYNFVVVLQIIWDIPNLVSTVNASYFQYSKQFAFTMEILVGMSQNICKTTWSLFLPLIIQI